MVVEIKAELENKVGLLSAHSHRAQILLLIVGSLILTNLASDKKISQGSTA
jgi:hypothetical protein